MKDNYFSFKILGYAFSWWLEGLSTWLPNGLQNKAQQKASVHCSIDGDILTFSALNKSGKKDNGLAIDLSSDNLQYDILTRWLKPYQKNEVILQLNEEHYLLKSITFPTQAKDNIDEMILFEIDRQTPFSAEEVYVGYSINDDNNEKMFSLLLAVVPKQFIRNIVDRLSSDSFQINSLLIHNSGNTIKIPLSESETHATSSFNYWLAALAFILTLLILYKPITYYKNALESLRAPLISAKKQAHVVSQLKEDNSAMIKHVQFLGNKTADYPMRLAVMNELARVLPKHTWLEHSNIRNSLLTLEGESASAADLITILTDSSYFSEVRFSAPTVPNERSGKARFKLQATIVSQMYSDEH